MKVTIKSALALLALGASTWALAAQDAPPSQNDRRPPPRQGGGGPGPNGQRPPMPVINALDANHDGVIDAGEIANASAALKTLDKNGDGQLTAEELRPARPPGPGPEGQGGGGQGRPPRGQRGPGGDRPQLPTGE